MVDSGHGDGVYINTAGIGVVPDGVDIRPDRARPGDVVIVSGDIGVHGIAVMSVREGLEFDTEIRSDCAPLNGLVATMLETATDLHCLRDPTRGGLGTSLNEIAAAWDAMGSQARDQLASEGFTGESARLRRSAALHYKGQSYELTVPVPDGPIDGAYVEGKPAQLTLEAFRDMQVAQAHRRLPKGTVGHGCAPEGRQGAHDGALPWRDNPNPVRSARLAS